MIPYQQYAKNILHKDSVFIICCMVITLSVTLASAYFHTGYWTAFTLAIGMYAIISFYAFFTKEKFLQRLLLFGIVAGFVELYADCWLVHNVASLVYPANEPKLACSPNYMPFAWAVVLIEVGYLGWCISNKVKMFEAMLLCMLIGIFFIPVFEQCAYWANWWYYNPCKMLLNTPWYIIVAEGIICFFLPAIFYLEVKYHWLSAFLLGLFEGIVIFLAYCVTYYLLA
ncbi:MAG: hypothetical protein IPI46_14560 [Bacteroidetes bacterium]|nr:hypothetical protein [Bacteroidota bacterium]